MGVATIGGIAFGYIGRQQPTAVKLGQIAVIENATVSLQSRRIGSQRRPRRKISKPENKKQKANNDT
jgi:hypothetical protein